MSCKKVHKLEKMLPMSVQIQNILITKVGDIGLTKIREKEFEIFLSLSDLLELSLSEQQSCYITFFKAFFMVYRRKNLVYFVFYVYIFILSPLR